MLDNKSKQVQAASIKNGLERSERSEGCIDPGGLNVVQGTTLRGTAGCSDKKIAR